MLTVGEKIYWGGSNLFYALKSHGAYQFAIINYELLYKLMPWVMLLEYWNKRLKMKNQSNKENAGNNWTARFSCVKISWIKKLCLSSRRI